MGWVVADETGHYSRGMIDRQVPQWPYQQAASLVRELIATGKMGPRLPSQMDLAHILGVSPMTAQRALQLLKDEGVIYAVPSLGTFVAEPETSSSSRAP